MKNFIVILVFVFPFYASEKTSYKNHKLYKIIPKDEDAVDFLKNLEDTSTDFVPYDFWSSVGHIDHPVSLMISPQFQNQFESLLGSVNADKEVVVENVQEIFDAEKPLSDGPNPVNWTLYNTLDEINGWLENLQAEFSDYLTLLRPGKSHQGRDIVGVKLDVTPDIQKKKIFVESNIHAREWITSAVTTYILDEFLRSNDVRISTMVNNYTWYFFPVMNPDGFVFSHNENRLWRKTRTRYNIFCWGADPNRNWDFKWMVAGASANPCSDIYGGPRALSEPSVRVMSEFITSIGDDLIAYLDFHSFSQMLLIPYGHTSEQLDNYAEMKKIGDIAAVNLKEIHGTSYTVGNVPELLYEASGSSMDWVKDTFKTPIVYTWELRDTGNYGFALPASQIIPTAEETLESVLTILEEYRARHF